MRAGRVAALACLAALVAGCDRSPGPEASRAAPGAEEARPAPGTLLFESADPGRREDLAALVRTRLAAFDIPVAAVEAAGPGRIRVRLEREDPALAERVEQLVTRPVAMAIAPVDPGNRFFEELEARLPADGKLRVARDRLGDLAHQKTVRIWYLAADNRAALDAFLKTAAPPPDRKLVPMYGSGGAVAYLVPDPPPVPNPMLTRVEVEGGGDAPVVVVAELARPFQDPFRDLVRDNLHRPLAFLVDGELVALPVVASKSKRGEIRIQPSPLVDPAEARKQAERLATKLRAWQLVGTFEKVGSQQVYTHKPLKDFGRSGLPD